MKYFFLLLLIAASVGVFVAVIIPRYDVIKTERSGIAANATNLATANQLQQSRDALIAQYNNIPKSDLDNVKTLLPDSVDNIRLIIQLDSLATKNGLSSLRSIEYNANQSTSTTTGTTSAAPSAPGNGSTAVSAIPTSTPGTANRPYGEFVISFQTTGQYSNFLSFLSDLEQNLRLVDVTDIQFTGANGSSGSQSATNGIGYKVTLKTYWLKQ